jgi:hypothetical protein
MTADAVFILDGGRIVESGDPATLLSDSSTRFAGLARAQLIPQDNEASVLELRGERGGKDAVRGPRRPATEHGSFSLRALESRWRNRGASS